MDLTYLTPHIIVHNGAINTGILVNGDKALLFDCCDTVTPELLSKMGVSKVEMILCTQHKRTNSAGAYPFVNSGTKLIVPEKERYLFDQTDSYWKDWNNRWHIYSFQPGPEVLAKPIKISRTVTENDIIKFESYDIRVLDTPGMTSGAVSYLVEDNGKTICFSGDVIYGNGQVLDIYSLQKGYDFGYKDYHGFLGNLRVLKPSLTKLGDSGADMLVPSHGTLVYNPKEAAQLTIERLDALWNNFVSVTSLNHYFPDMLCDKSKAFRIKLSPENTKTPDFLIRFPETTWVLKSDTGAALVMDCGNDKIVDKLRYMIESGDITSVDAVWVTHYHDDHVDCLGRLYNELSCPIIVEEHMSDIITHPRKYLLPCISPTNSPVSRIVKSGECWQWHEFTMTAYHFPCENLYHAALFVEGHGKRILFAGDSFSPNGIDDNAAANRVFIGKGKGYDYCLELLSQLNPDLIINSHQQYPMNFTNDEIAHLRHVLKNREEILIKLLPWDNPNFGIDQWWARTYPYEQDVFAGSACVVNMQFTNHSGLPAKVSVEPVLPEGWMVNINEYQSETEIAPNKDSGILVSISVPANVEPGQYIIPFRITWNRKYLGQMRHAVIWVMK